jgi:homospermidine synthase
MKIDKIGGVSDYRKSTMKKIIKDFKVGTVLMSEIDNIKLPKEMERKLENKKIYNTWSVIGFLTEALDPTELVVGNNNKFIQPNIENSKVNRNTVDIYKKIDSHNKDYSVIFLNKLGIYSTLNSICPILVNNTIEFTNYRGKLIHHGEMFELARYFGKNAPFMSYVYKTNKYLDESILQFKNTEDLWLYSNQENGFQVFDNIKNPKGLIGHDSIGCTIFCGDKDIERIFWCGSILSDTDKNVDPNFTPTVVQVVAGVLSGLSFILESEPMGWVEPIDLDTEYILEKSIPLLGKFFFTEIDAKQFDKFIID